jgi:hypothetical protein
MTCEQALTLLDDYVDGGLTEAEHQELELHIASCEACRKEERSLRAFLADAVTLKRDRVPARDLWPAIEQRLRNERRVLRFFRPGMAIPAGLAAAAALIVAVLWMRASQTPLGGVGPAGGTLTPAAAGTPVDMAQAEAEYLRATNQLLEVLNARKKNMPAEEAKALDENMLKIDASLRQVREALDKDPQNPKLTRMLASTHQKKLDLLLRLIRLSSQIS